MLHHLLHPTGWWIVLDVIIFGCTVTGGILLYNGDSDGWWLL